MVKLSSTDTNAMCMSCFTKTNSDKIAVFSCDAVGKRSSTHGGYVTISTSFSRESLKSLVFDDRHKLYTSGGIPIAHTYGSSAFILVADTDKLSGAQIDDLISILVYLFVRNKTSTVRVDTPRVLNEAEFHGPPLGGLA